MSKVTFYISEFNTNVNANKLLFTPTDVPVITGDIQTTISVPVANVKSMFQFTNAGGVTSAQVSQLVSNSSTLFKFSNPTTTIDFTTCKVVSGPSYAVTNDSIGATYIRYIANSIFGDPTAASSFTDYTTMDDTINGTVQTAIVNQFSINAAANPAIGLTNAVTSNNPTYKLFRQFGAQLGPRFTQAMLDNTSTLQPVPLLANDEIVFKFTLKPESTQYSVNGGVNPISDVTGTIKIICV